MIQASDLSYQNPWPGLLAYKKADRQFFYGRQEVADEVFRLVRRNTLTLVFGTSGTGKTSLLQAGLIPRLRAEGFAPQRVRRLTVAAGNVPVVAFDQFEEIFTLGDGRPESTEFPEQLADLVENYFPSTVRSRLEPGESLDFDSDRQDYRVVLVLRDEYVSHLDVLRRRMPAVMRTRLRLDPFTAKQAEDVVKGPGAEVLEPGVAAEIVKVAASNGRGQSVIDPAILSLLCRELTLRREGRKISTGQLRDYSDKILSDFWDNRIATLPDGSRQPVREFVEDSLRTPDGFRTAAPRNRMAAHEPAVQQLIDSRVLRFRRALRHTAP